MADPPGNDEAPEAQLMDRSAEPSLQKAVKVNGRWINPWGTYADPPFGVRCQFLCCFLCSRCQREFPNKQELDAKMPVIKADFDPLVGTDGLAMTWIGHSTTVVKIDGLTVLTDPVWSKRCSPFKYIGPARYRDTPCNIADIPKIDAVIISHNHYDHLDIASVKELNARFGNSIHWFVPMDTRSWMISRGCVNVTEMEWWDEASIPSRPDVKFVCTPAQHFCNRALHDRNKVLWGSWCVIGPKHRFFFGGDTAYCSSFTEIGNKFGPFDLGAIPIGAYEPNAFMRNIHVNPEEAVKIHEDIKCKLSMAVHWGTFDLANETPFNPVERLKAELNRKGIKEEEFIHFKHGETRLF